MLNDKDLEFFNCEPSIVDRLLHLKQTELLETVKCWLNVPELNSNNSTLDDYMLLKTGQIVDRMRNIDWVIYVYMYIFIRISSCMYSINFFLHCKPNGFHACQIAHLKLKSKLRV